MKIYPESKFPKKSGIKGWDALISYHGFESWDVMCDTLLETVSWNGVLDYKTYKEWFEFYYSPLALALREE